MQRLYTLDVVENERENQAMGNHMEGLHTNKRGSLPGYQWHLGSAIMMSHGMTLLALTMVNDEMWPNAHAALVVVHPIWPGEEEDDYIVVVLEATLCHMELCADA